MYNFYYKKLWAFTRPIANLLFVMRLTTMILTLSVLQLSANTFAQKIKLSEKNAPLLQVFDKISLQSGYDFFVSKDLLEQAGPVNIDIKNDDIRVVLDEIFHNQPLSYVIEDRFVKIQKKEQGLFNKLTQYLAETDIKGQILDENHRPLVGAVIQVIGMEKTARSDQSGNFHLMNVPEQAVIRVSFIGFLSKDISLKELTKSGIIIMKEAIGTLDETIVQGYGTITQRLNTGNIIRVTAAEIDRQPISSPLGALQGKVTGLDISQTDGLPGGYYSVVIRGKNSISEGSEPLYVVDGVPFTNESMGTFPGTKFSTSPINTIDPKSIESIEVLKDADATAIYGSRGANGVILITTKGAKISASGFDATLQTGFNAATRLIKMMNTQEYLTMRKEAYKNDNIIPTALNAPDLMAWDTTRYVDWQKMAIGDAGHNSNFNMSFVGGNSNTSFRLGGGYHEEVPLYSQSSLSGKGFFYKRGSVDLNVLHTSNDKKFNISLTVRYSLDNSNYSQGVYSASSLITPPNAPYPYDKEGNLVWSEGGASFNNPFGTLGITYNAKNNILTNNVNASYKILRDLTFITSAGYTNLQYNDVQAAPKAAQNPLLSPVSYTYFNDKSVTTWIIEPQLKYKRKFGPGNLEALIGGSLQNQTINAGFQSGTDYSSDALVGTLSGATTYNAQLSGSQYRYNALFGRINYNINNTYIINASGRRDGSSRFGPGRQYANFGAIGLAYIFSETKFIQDKLPFLSFGKLRGSYGVTGSDNIGDNMFLDAWSITPGSYYQGQNGIAPNRLFNENYAWETNRKLEGGLELGFLKNRIMLTTSWYQNRSGNQLINYQLPNQTGFSSILSNFDAVVQNRGWEFTLQTQNIREINFSWSSNFNISLSKNKLLSFPGIENTSYNSTYIVGRPLSLKRFLHYTGIDSKTGLFTFESTDRVNGRTVIVDDVPAFFGGVSNSFTYKKFQLDIFLQFEKQNKLNYLSQITTVPGTLGNQPEALLDRWQNPGDVRSFQLYTTSSAGATAWKNYTTYSDAAYSDASYIRLKNVSLNYRLPTSISQKIKSKVVNVFFQGQNMAVLTHYKVGDPESGGLGNPLVSTYSIGIKLGF